MIGSLMYTVTGTRPDLAFTVTRLSQFLTQPTKYHIGAAKHVLRYLKGTRDLKLLFPLGQAHSPTQVGLAHSTKQGQTQQHGAAQAQLLPQLPTLTLEGFTDSDLAGCPDTRRGYVFKLAGATICWRSRKQ